MALGALQFHAADAAGNVLANATVTIRKEVAGAPLADLYEDRDGETPLANPTVTDEDGFCRVFAPGGAYRVDVESGENSVTLRYVPVGTAQELDFDGEPYVPGGDPVAIADGGTGADNVEDAFDNLKQAATTDSSGVVEKATDAEVRSAAADKYLAADHIESASAAVELASASSFDWEAGFYRTLTLSGNATLGNPTNAHPGTWRTVLVEGNSATERTLAFGNQYGGEVPTLDDITSSKKYLLMIFCKAAGQFIAAAMDGSDA